VLRASPPSQAVVTVRLEHQDAGQAAHPVDPGETGRRGRSHERECNLRSGAEAKAKGGRARARPAPGRNDARRSASGVLAFLGKDPIVKRRFAIATAIFSW
jgi:hypothetical protein